MTEREVTLAELAEDVNGLAFRIDKLIEQTGQTYVRRDVYDAEQHALRAEQARQADSIKWATRTAVASFLLPIMVTIIAGIALAVIL